MNPSSFSKYLNADRHPGAVVLERLSHLGVNVNWLLTGEGAPLVGSSKASPIMPGRSQSDGQEHQDEEHSGSSGSEEQFQRVPLVRIREDPDDGLRLIETGKSEWVETSFIREEYGVEPQLLRDFHITGDSMADTMQPGERARAVLWDCRPPNDGTVCILQGPVCLLIRRIRLKGKNILLVADNPDVPTREIDKDEWEDEYEPIARIVEVRRAL